VVPALEAVGEILAAGHVHLAQLGTTDDCGFAPFADDGSTGGTKLATEQLGA